MPRYFFHIRTPDGRLMRDEIGVELADFDAASREAFAAARGFDADRERGGPDYSGCYFEIRSKTGSLNTPAFMKKLTLARPY